MYKKFLNKALVGALVLSTIATTIPVQSFAAEKKPLTVKSSDQELLTNTEFTTPMGWMAMTWSGSNASTVANYGTFPASPGTDGQYVVKLNNLETRFASLGNKTMSLYGQKAAGLAQTVSTIAGHVYQVKFTASPSSSTTAQMHANVKDGNQGGPSFGILQSKNLYTSSEAAWSTPTGVETVGQFTAASSQSTLTLEAEDGFVRYSNVSIKDVTLAKTTINDVYDTDKSVSGTGETLGTVVIKNTTTQQVIGQGTVLENGTYNITIPAQKANDQIEATVTKNNQTSSATTTVKEGTLANPTINTVSDKDTVVTGKATPGATVTISIPQTGGGFWTNSDTAQPDGSYSIPISKQKAGTKIYAQAKLGAKESATVNTTVIDKTPPAAPQVNPVNTEQTTVIGKTEPNAVVKVKVNGTVIGTGTATATGDYTVTIPKQKVGTNLNVTATDKAGNESAATTVVVTDAPKDYSLTVPVNYTIGQQTIEGSYGKDIAYVRLWVNDVVVAQATTSNGHYVINGINKWVFKKADKVVVKGVDSKYIERAAKPVTVVGTDVVADYALTANPYSLGKDITVTGTAGKDIKQVKLKVNGTAVATGTVTNGQYTIENAKKFILDEADKVEVVGVDAQQVERKTVAVPLTGAFDYALTVDNNESFVLGSQADISGTHGKDIISVRLWINDKPVTAATLTGTNGYVFKNPEFRFTKNDKVEVVGVNARYNVKKRILVHLVGNDDFRLKANSYALGDPKLKGTTGADVKSVGLKVNGTVVDTVTPEDQIFAFTNAKDQIQSRADQVQVVAYDKDGKEVNTVDVEIGPAKDYSLNITNSPYIVGTYDYVTGTAGTDVQYVRLYVDGKSVKNSTYVHDDGRDFNLYVYDYVKSDYKNHIIEVVAIDKSGDIVNRLPLRIADGQL